MTANAVLMEWEPAQRGVTLAQHVYDLLRARFLARRGRAMGELLWVLGESVSQERGGAGPTPGERGSRRGQRVVGDAGRMSSSEWHHAPDGTTPTGRIAMPLVGVVPYPVHPLQGE